jgi:hypothetical protein
MKTLLIAILFAYSPMAMAIPTLTDLTEDDAKIVVEDFSANFVHTTVSTASSLGDKFGIQLGAFGGLTTSKGIDDLVDEDFGYIPHANIVGIITVPYGFGLEAALFPKTETDGLNMENHSFALRWTLTDAFAPNGFVALQILGHYGFSRLSYAQTVATVPVNVGFQSISTGGDLKVSLSGIPYIEPYASVGYVSAKGKLESIGTASIFDTAYTTEQKAEIDVNGLRSAAGLKFKLPFIAVVTEYSKVMNNTRVSLKVALEHGM